MREEERKAKTTNLSRLTRSLSSSSSSIRGSNVTSRSDLRKSGRDVSTVSVVAGRSDGSRWGGGESEGSLVGCDRLVGSGPFHPFEVVEEDVLLLRSYDHSGLAKKVERKEGRSVEEVESRPFRDVRTKTHSTDPHETDSLLGGERVLVDKPSGDEASSPSESSFAVDLSRRTKERDALETRLLRDEGDRSHTHSDDS